MCSTLRSFPYLSIANKNSDLKIRRVYPLFMSEFCKNSFYRSSFYSIHRVSHACTGVPKEALFYALQPVEQLQPSKRRLWNKERKHSITDERLNPTSVVLTNWIFHTYMYKSQKVIPITGEWVNLLFYVTTNDISVIHLTAHRYAGGLKKKFDLLSGFQRHRHFVGFFNLLVQARTRGHPFYSYHMYCGWLIFASTNFCGLDKNDTFVGFKIRGHGIFFHSLYRKLPFRGYWNL